MPLNPGVKAPDFSLPDQLGTARRLKELRGSAVVLFFYPKDDTEDCTAEACSFSDARERITRAGAVVLGISRLDVKSKAKFARKHTIEIPLLADESTEVSAAYGVLREKSMYGKKYMGIDRTTFLIDSSGVIAKRWDLDGVEHHTDDVLAAIKQLKAGTLPPGAVEAKPAAKKKVAKKSAAKRSAATKPIAKKKARAKRA